MTGEREAYILITYMPTVLENHLWMEIQFGQRAPALDASRWRRGSIVVAGRCHHRTRPKLTYTNSHDVDPHRIKIRYRRLRRQCLHQLNHEIGAKVGESLSEPTTNSGREAFSCGLTVKTMSAPIDWPWWGDICLLALLLQRLQSPTCI